MNRKKRFFSGQEAGKHMRSPFRRAVLLLTILCVFPFASFAGEAESAFSVRRIGNLVPFADNTFQINVPENGTLTVTVHDDISVYRVLTWNVPAGESELRWDGCGYNRERLSPKTYRITASFQGISGYKAETSFNTPVEYSAQDLQYVLPSAPEVFLKAGDDWFLELKTIQKGTVVAELSQQGTGQIYTARVNTVGGKLYRISFNTLFGRQTPPEGKYCMKVYETTVPGNLYEFELDVLPGAPEQKKPFVTGKIIPDEEMTDAEIWQMMQRPSVVIDIDFFKHQKVYKEKDSSSEVLGTLHGQTQALEVMRLEDEWALVGAWNHEEAEYVEGWVPSSVLKVENPGKDFGLLVNKKKQTLTVFYRGERLDSLRVSTGIPEKNHLDQETAAGVFLTGYHRVDFSTNGKKFDYVIQYDGGNMMHQIPYRWGTNKKDFSVGRDVLGKKASHACIRVQAEPGESGINAYWLWTHLPYHTRIIILDDPEERHALYDSLR